MLKLYDYQENLKRQVCEAWGKHKNVLLVLPCRAGKTVIFTNIIAETYGTTVILAHRAELVYQASMTLCKYGLKHNIIAAKTTIRQIISDQIKRFGRCFYDSNEKNTVASVQTLLNLPESHPIFHRCELWVTDECHHLVIGTVWEKCISRFRNAKGLGVTATPCRSDGKGLGREAHGLMDVMVEGITASELIERKFIAPYRIFAPRNKLDLSHVAIASNGDYQLAGLKDQLEKAKITGCVVGHYKRLIPGKKALVFTVDVASAEVLAENFREEGIKAVAVSGASEPAFRAKALMQLEKGEISVVCNCELFGEGTDLPAIDAVILVRPTKSYGLYYQQVFRPMSRNPENPDKVAYIIDHVGNVYEHGLPDTKRHWSLLAREHKSASKRSEIRICEECSAAYSRVEHGLVCPYCGYKKEPVDRSEIEQVDGDLLELSLETLKHMISKIDTPPIIPYNTTPIIKNSILKRHKERQEAVSILKETMAMWASDKVDIPAAQREFYLKFGIDVLTAQTLNRRDTDDLTKRIERS